jgi:UDP-N-acetylglucosamine diphosphorylase/glucosamine-1-phosphate N-acetyltransferase
MKLVLADLHHDSLKPLTETRSVADVEVGGATIQEHIERELEPEKTFLLVPQHLEEVTRRNSELYGVEREVNSSPEDFILYNSGVIPNQEIEEKLEGLDPGQGIFTDGKFVAGRPEEDLFLEDLEETVEALEMVELEGDFTVLEYPWDLVEHTPELVEDSFPGGEINGEVTDEAVIEGGEDSLYLGEGSEIGPNAYLDVSDGPIFIGEETKIFPNSRITGPAYIGSNTKVGAGQTAVIHEGTHIGDVCRAGGEVEEAVVHSFTNKYHYGFLGHAVVGSWVNLGAGTTNSDLKNTYGTVTVNHPSEGEVEAGLKVGAMIGDHSKFGISTAVHTGKVIEPFCFVTRTVDTDLESFTWFSDGEQKEYIPEKAVEHIERMMSHREEFLPDGYIEAQKNLLRELAEE